MSPLEMKARHLTENTVPPVASLWKCPACAGENQGPLEQGCVSCGAGKPGRRAEQPLVQVVPSTSSTVQYKEHSTTRTAFDAWWRVAPNYPSVLPTPALVDLAFLAFEAGMEYGRGLNPLPLQDPPPSPDTPLVPGDATSRTLAAALGMFIENILVHGPDEVQDGTWLSAEEARKVLETLEGAE